MYSIVGDSTGEIRLTHDPAMTPSVIFLGFPRWKGHIPTKMYQFISQVAVHGLPILLNFNKPKKKKKFLKELVIMVLYQVNAKIKRQKWHFPLVN